MQYVIKTYADGNINETLLFPMNISDIISYFSKNYQNLWTIFYLTHSLIFLM